MKINPYDITPETIAGHDRFDFYVDGEISGSYNRDDGMSNHELCNELFDAAVSIARCDNVLMVNIAIDF